MRVLLYVLYVQDVRPQEQYNSLISVLTLLRRLRDSVSSVTCTQVGAIPDESNRERSRRDDHGH